MDACFSTEKSFFGIVGRAGKVDSSRERKGELLSGESSWNDRGGRTNDYQHRKYNKRSTYAESTYRRIPAHTVRKACKFKR